jgi:hypothetical protein
MRCGCTSTSILWIEVYPERLPWQVAEGLSTNGSDFKLDDLGLESDVVAPEKRGIFDQGSLTGRN